MFSQLSNEFVNAGEILSRATAAEKAENDKRSSVDFPPTISHHTQIYTEAVCVIPNKPNVVNYTPGKIR